MARRIIAARHYQRDDDPTLRLSRSAMLGVARDLRHAFNNLSKLVDVAKVAEALRHTKHPAHVINFHHYREVLRGVFSRLGKLRQAGGELGARKINGAFAAKRRAVRFRKSKASKIEANYRRATDGRRRCGDCWMFQAPQACCAVEGVIQVWDTCDFFETIWIKPEEETAVVKGPGHDVSDEPRDDHGRWTTGGGAVSRAERWAREGDAKGLTSIFDPAQYGDPTVYHGVAAGQERSGFLFVTRSQSGAAFHGDVQGYKIRPGARVYADIETSTRRTGAQTLFGAKEGNSSGIIHISDLIPVAHITKATGDQFTFDSFSPAVQRQIRQEQDRLIQQLEDDARDTINQVIRDGILNGDDTDVMAENIKEVIGLTDTQAQATLNYQRMLENLDSGALQRQLRNKDYDAVLQDAIDAGTDLSDAAIENMVADYVDNYLDYRSATIAQTESTRAANQGLHDAYSQAIDRGALPDEAVTRQWQLGDSPCKICESIVENNPDGVGVNENFDSDDGPIDDPPVHPNCECSVDYVTDLSLVPDDGEDTDLPGPGSFGVGGVDTPYMDDENSGA